MTVSVKNAHLAGLLQRMESHNERIQELAGGLGRSQLEWTPPEGGWGVGRILEHLIRSIEMYYDVLPNAIEKARASDKTDAGAPWKSTMMGNWLIKTLKGPRKVKTFKRFEAQTVEDRVVERLLEAQSRMERFMRSADGLDLNGTRIKSPAFGLIRYNLADCFVIHTEHTERHLNRAEEIAKMADFPATAAV